MVAEGLDPDRLEGPPEGLYPLRSDRSNPPPPTNRSQFVGDKRSGPVRQDVFRKPYRTTPAWSIGQYTNAALPYISSRSTGPKSRLSLDIDR